MLENEVYKIKDKKEDNRLISSVDNRKLYFKIYNYISLLINYW